MATVNDFAQAERFACAPAGTAENPSRTVKETNPSKNSSKVNKQNAQRRIAEGNSKKQNKVDVHLLDEWRSMAAQQLVLVSNALEYGQRHGSGVCVSFKTPGCKMTVSLFPRAGSSRGEIRAHIDSSRGQIRPGRTPDRSWRARTTENGERPHGGFGRQEEPNLDGSQSPPRPLPTPSPAQGSAATRKMPQVSNTPTTVQGMSEVLGVDPSVAALALQDHEGDFEKATVSLCRAIQEERVREDTPKGFHSDAQQPQKKSDGRLGSAGPMQNVALPCVPHNTVSVPVDSNKPIHGDPGSTSTADAACGNATNMPVSTASNKMKKATVQGRGAASGTGRGGRGGDRSGGRGKGPEGVGERGNMDNPQAG